MSMSELLSMAYTPVRRRLRIAFLQWQIDCNKKNRDVLLRQSENDRLAAAYLQREACILQADLNLLIGRKS